MIKSSKATKEQLRRHNRQLLLHAVYSGQANSRVALAQETSLAKPTVSDLIAELIDEGFLEEVGHGESTESGGKRPRLLQFIPNARNVIGIALTETRISGILTNLDGQITAQHHIELTSDSSQNLLENLTGVINGLVAQLDARLLCLGIGVPGTTDASGRVVHFMPHLGWPEMPLVQLLEDEYEVPVYIENNTKLAAMAQFAFGREQDLNSLVTVQINHTVEVGYILGGAAYHSGGDISSVNTVPLFLTHAASPQPLEAYVSWSQVKQRAAILRSQYADSSLPEAGFTYLHLRYHAANGDKAALILYTELADYLAQIFTWIIALLRPQHITLAGGIGDLGDEFLNCAVGKTTQLIAPELVESVTFSIATLPSLSALGAVAQALQRDLGFIS